MGRQRKACLPVLLVALAIQSAAAFSETQLPSTVQPGSLSPSGEPAQASPRPRLLPEQLRFLPAPDSVVIERPPQIEVIVPPDPPDSGPNGVVVPIGGTNIAMRVNRQLGRLTYRTGSLLIGPD
jgi:hypothetical protein